MTAGPLSGIQVLDLSRAMAGPFCTQLLSDMGARVIAVDLKSKAGREMVLALAERSDVIVA